MGRRDRPVRARLAAADERQRLWPRLVRLNPEWADYQARISREIPVVILEPRPGG